MKNEKKANVVAKVVKKAAAKIADVSCGAASYWGMYQTKEPKSLKK